MNNDVDIPIKFGNDKDVSLYASLLINGERQLLITEDTLKLYLTNGNGEAIPIRIESSNINVKVDGKEKSSTMALQDLINEHMKNDKETELNKKIKEMEEGIKMTKENLTELQKSLNDNLSKLNSKIYELEKKVIDVCNKTNKAVSNDITKGTE